MSRLAVSLVLVAAACAAPQEPRNTAPPGATSPRAAPSAEEAPVCHEESVTGSNLTRTVCRSKSDSERERDDAQTFSTKNSRMRQTTTGH
ncbi:MAG TPA: hypothetical protein VN253_00630 [Kofleriaceae bacterium]|nr:hypothetical protein [Kofleriaceae bacterium]